MMSHQRQYDIIMTLFETTSYQGSRENLSGKFYMLVHLPCFLAIFIKEKNVSLSFISWTKVLHGTESKKKNILYGGANFFL